MNPLHATIEEFAAEGYTHVEANCPRCRVIRLTANRPASENLDGAHARLARAPAAMRRLRWSAAVGQAVATD